MFKKIAILTILMWVLPKYAYAYIDPGAGSCVFQIIIATLVIGLFFIKVIFNKVKIFFTRLFFRKNVKP